MQGPYYSSSSPLPQLPSPSTAVRRSKEYCSMGITVGNNTDIIMFRDAYAATTTQCHHRKKRRRPKLYTPPCFSSSSAAVLLFLILTLSRSLLASSASESLQQMQENNEVAIEEHQLSSPFRIVIDVGSTGSRLHIFELVTTIKLANSSDDNTSSSSDKNSNTNTNVENESSPRTTECLRRGSSKAWTPMSAFASTDDDNSSRSISSNDHPKREPLNATHVAHHMLPLFDYASIIIPHQFHRTTPVRIAATAGMRLLPLEEQTRVYDALHTGLLEQVGLPHGRFTFTDLKRKDVLTLNGEREGFYGAVAANYLRGVVDAELRVIVPPEGDENESKDVVIGDCNVQHNDVTQSEQHDFNDQGLCTNKFGMCEQDAEDIVFGPSHHYVSQNIHDVKRHGPLGALDMGGSSTQIVYRHTADGSGTYKPTSFGTKEESGSNESAESEMREEYHDVPSHLNGEEFFSTSYLSYGADQFRERLWDLWVSEAEKSLHSPPSDIIVDHNNHGEQHNLPVIFNPCSFVGYQMSYKSYSLLGTGNAILCAEQINRLIPHHDNVIDLDELYDENMDSSLSKNEEQHLGQSMKRKMVGGVEHPPLRGKFYGMSLYFFTLDCLRELSDPDHPIHVSWPTPSIEELTHALDAFCARSWQGDLEEVQHEAHEHTRAEVLPHRCVEAVYMVTLLRDGFGFHPSSRDITFAQRVEGNEVEWSLGMALSEFAEEKGRQRDDDDMQ